MVRVLVAARVSVDKDSKVDRIEQDDEAARNWAQSQPDTTVITTTIDRGVSGAVDPFERAGLGPWLVKPELVSQYDCIVASAIDRLGRNAVDLFNLRLWAETHGKRLIILAGNLQWPPAAGDMASGMIWDVLGRVADIELSMMKKRIKDTRTDMKSRKVLLGKAPFGFEIIGDRRAKTLRPVESLRPVLEGMVKRALRGDTLASIARWLDSQNVKPGQADRPNSRQTEEEAARWSPKSVSQILRNPALKGRRYENGETVLLHEGIMNGEQWDNLQAVLNSRPSNRRGNVTAKSPWMIGNIVCNVCGKPMYHYRNVGTTKTYEYYRCHGTTKTPSRCKNMVPKAAADDFVNRTILDNFGKVELIERVLIPGEDFASDIADVEAQISQLRVSDPGFDEKLSILRGRYNDLMARKPEGAHYEERPTGQYLADLWPTLPDDVKRIFLQESGIKLLVTPGQILVLTGDPHLTRVAVRRIEELQYDK